MLHCYSGLSVQQVEESRRKHGENTLSSSIPPNIYFWVEEITNCWLIRYLVILEIAALIVVMTLYLIMEDLSSIIGWIMVGLAVLIMFGILWKYAKAVKKEHDCRLRNAEKEDKLVKVVRNNEVQEVRSRDIVVGDIILLQEGDEVPADATLLEAHELLVDEGSNNGHSVIHKHLTLIENTRETCSDDDQLMRGTTILHGEAIAEVYAVGIRTEEESMFYELPQSLKQSRTTR